MPAHRKQLPRPCPMCGKENGTVQIVIFRASANVICRIAHYDPKKYDPKKYGLEFVKSGSRGKSWCKFKINRVFVSQNLPQLERDIDNLASGYFRNRICLQYTNPILLLDSIMRNGWNGEGLGYLIALSKTLGLWERFLKIPGFNGGEKNISKLLEYFGPKL